MNREQELLNTVIRLISVMEEILDFIEKSPANRMGFEILAKISKATKEARKILRY